MCILLVNFHIFPFLLMRNTRRIIIYLFWLLSSTYLSLFLYWTVSYFGMAAVVVTLSGLALRASGATSLDATTAASLAANKSSFYIFLPWHYGLTFSCFRGFQHTISTIVNETPLRNISSDLRLLSFLGNSGLAT